MILFAILLIYSMVKTVFIFILLVYSYRISTTTKVTKIYHLILLLIFPLSFQLHIPTTLYLSAFLPVLGNLCSMVKIQMFVITRYILLPLLLFCYFSKILCCVYIKHNFLLYLFICIWAFVISISWLMHLVQQWT